jgi:hypothetical protein
MSNENGSSPHLVRYDDVVLIFDYDIIVNQLHIQETNIWKSSHKSCNSVKLSEVMIHSFTNEIEFCPAFETSFIIDQCRE